MAEFTYPQLQDIGEDYERDGFVIVRNVLPAGLIREVDRHIDWLMERHPELPPESLGHWLIACDPFWIRFLSDRHLLDVAEALVGPNVAFSRRITSASRPEGARASTGTRTATTGPSSPWRSLQSGSPSPPRCPPMVVSA